MKKIKIMLLSFAILAIVGGALAFKAKGTQSYCTADVDQINLCTDGAGTAITCPNGPIISTTVEAQVSFCYTTPLSGRSDCKKANNVDFLPCRAQTTSLKAD